MANKNYPPEVRAKIEELEEEIRKLKQSTKRPSICDCILSAEIAKMCGVYCQDLRNKVTWLSKVILPNVVTEDGRGRVLRRTEFLSTDEVLKAQKVADEIMDILFKYAKEWRAE